MKRLYYQIRKCCVTLVASLNYWAFGSLQLFCFIIMQSWSVSFGSHYTRKLLFTTSWIRGKRTDIFLFNWFSNQRSNIDICLSIFGVYVQVVWIVAWQIYCNIDGFVSVVNRSFIYSNYFDPNLLRRIHSYLHPSLSIIFSVCYSPDDTCIFTIKD